jgi:hypothetical protein
MWKSGWTIWYQHPCQVSQFSEEVEMATHLLLNEKRLQSAFFTKIDICDYEGLERMDSFQGRAGLFFRPTVL